MADFSVAIEDLKASVKNAEEIINDHIRRKIPIPNETAKELNKLIRSTKELKVSFIRGLSEQKVPGKKIADMFNLSPSRISQMVHKNGSSET